MKSRIKVGVRFCGGCNPRYDRGETYRILQESLPGICFEYLVPGRCYDGYLLICGCLSQCAGHSGIDEERPVFTLTAPEDVKEAAAFFMAADHSFKKLSQLKTDHLKT